MAIDTACSSSLVALHQACNALHAGEASIAMVAGVNLLLHPYPFIGFSNASMLSAGGRCRAFDAAGDGYVRAEGGALLLLKPLRKAIADGDYIEAIIRASGVNADGARKTSLTIPSQQGQVALMRSVLQRSGLQAADIAYVEAHGTGTAVGDPVEALAIGEVYGRCRPAGQPLPIGSIKTNLGHLEPASGMAGLAKALTMLKHRTIPPSLHFGDPNSQICLKELNLDVVTSTRELSRANTEDCPLVIGINSFGFGGANAHVLLQEFKQEPLRSNRNLNKLPPLILSAKTTVALRALAGRYADTLRHQDPSGYYDIAHCAAFRREWLDKRLAVAAEHIDALVDQLDKFALGENEQSEVLEDALSEPGSLAFVRLLVLSG
jgi:acyl transferase domain-containing protein